MSEWGIDVSRWQGNFNFEKAKAEGIKFAILKAGGGDAGLYKDGKFDRNYSECQRLGIPMGVYYFGKAMDISTAQKEAEHFLSIIQGRQYPMNVWYDVEAKMLNASNLPAIVNAFVNIVNSRGYRCGVYASESTFKGKLKSITAPKWVARWTKTQPTIEYEIWQFGGETNLIRSNKVAGQVCDQNYYKGSTPAPAPKVTKVKVSCELPMIKKGSKGSAVKIWQTIVGCTADGDFGSITEANTRKFQSTHLDSNGKKLDVDGIVGSLTWSAGLNSLS